MTKFAIVMIAYALAMLGVGYLTYSVAPPGSNAWTALLVPGIGAAAVTACVIMGLRIDGDRRLGMIGIHAGLALPLLMSIGSFARLPGSLQKNRDYYEHSLLKTSEGETTGVGTVTGKTHPTGYQAVGIGSIGTLSLFAFVSVLLLRPKPPALAVAAAPPVNPEPPKPRTEAPRA